MSSASPPRNVDAGPAGLDTVLDGGFLYGHPTILNDGPGTGKTFVALQFLGVADVEALSIGFEEREQERQQNADRLGVNLSAVSILNVSANGTRGFSGDAYVVFSDGSRSTKTQTSSLADSLIFLQCLELDNEFENGIGVLTKRFSGFEQSRRELKIDTGGLYVGERLSGVRGTRTGVPEPPCEVR